MKLRLPFFKQHTDYSCGPASLEMVLAFFGDKESENFLIKTAHTDKNFGTKHEWMIKTGKSEGFYCHSNSNSSIHEIEHFLLIGLPVIVDYTEPSENIGHYSVITGFKGNEIIMNDPWNGRNFSISKSEFMSRWHDNITKSQKWIMVISKNSL